MKTIQIYGDLPLLEAQCREPKFLHQIIGQLSIGTPVHNCTEVILYLFTNTMEIHAKYFDPYQELICTMIAAWEPTHYYWKVLSSHV